MRKRIRSGGAYLVGIALISLLALTSGLVLGHDAGRASVAAARDYVVYLPVVLSG